MMCLFYTPLNDCSSIEKELDIVPRIGEKVITNDYNCDDKTCHKYLKPITYEIKNIVWVFNNMSMHVKIYVVKTN